MPDTLFHFPSPVQELVKFYFTLYEQQGHEIKGSYYDLSGDTLTFHLHLIALKWELVWLIIRTPNLLYLVSTPTFTPILLLLT